jgi:hypothetical protein
MAIVGVLFSLLIIAGFMQFLIVISVVTLLREEMGAWIFL